MLTVLVKRNCSGGFAVGQGYLKRLIATFAYRQCNPSSTIITAFTVSFTHMQCMHERHIFYEQTLVGPIFQYLSLKIVKAC